MHIQIPDYSKTKVLIVGDVMLDRYWHGGTSRISPEAPVPVVKISQIEERPGGAGNVALSVATLGAQVTLLGMIGEDEAGQVLNNCLAKAGIKCRLLFDPNLPTITKLRVLSQHQQLIRLDFEKNFKQSQTDQLLDIFKAELSSADVVVLSDYGKGALKNSKQFIALARKAKIPVFIDPKSADFSVYHGATVITPNLKEFQAVVGSCDTEEEIVKKANALLKTYELEALLITRGEHGMTLFTIGKEAMHVSARAQEVYDVTGAGDTVIATLAASVGSGMDLAEAVNLANVAAGISVSKLGAATVSISELRRAIQNAKSGRLMNEEQLLLAIEDAHAHGEKVVMTNGCFDILHVGHVHYLEQAKNLGDRLIVAVNDDASVSRLKGKNRPINSLDKRMKVLSSLSSVDWVVSFSEDTPRRLISKLLPDVLVKGGDWKVEEIAGADAVLKNGGEVKVLNFVDGYSTTGVIEKIQKGLRIED